MDADRFTVRCVQPYKKNDKPHIVRPWAFKKAPMCHFVSLRDENDKVRNITISRLAMLTYGGEYEDLPKDLEEIPGFSCYRYSPFEDVVVIVDKILRKPYTPHRIGKYIRKGSPEYVSHLRDDHGVRFTLTMPRIRDLIKGTAVHTPRDNFDDALPAFMRYKPTRGTDSYQRAPYGKRKVDKPVDPTEDVTQRGGPATAQDEAPQPANTTVHLTNGGVVIISKPVAQNFKCDPKPKSGYRRPF